MGVDVDRYLERIGIASRPGVDVDSLTELQRAHMTAVPFENLDIVFGDGVDIDPHRSIEKIVDRRRGGWCFELNGAFAELLTALGYEVRLLGAAVLLGGPSTVLDHLALEVTLDEPYLVDVGFGESFITPIALNRAGPQDGGIAQFELLGSPQGTTLAQHVDGVPEARYRFKRVAHRIEDFEPISTSMQTDPDLHWRSKPFATRLLDGGPDRVVLREGRLKVTVDGVDEITPVADDEFAAALREWFEMNLPG